MSADSQAKATGDPAARSRGGTVLILSLHYAPEITGNAPLVTALARGLAARGFSVRVVAGTPHYGLPEVPAPYRGRLYLREQLDGVAITRCFAFRARHSRRSKIANFFSFLTTSLPAALAGPRPDWVLVVSPPFLLGLVGAVVKYLRGAKLVYNAQDIFPRAYVTGGMLREGWLARRLAGMQRWIYRRADVVTTIAPALAEELAAEGVPPAKIRMIPNFADEEALHPLPRDNEFSRQHGLADRFVALYAGNIGTLQGTELLVPLAKRLEVYPDILVLVVGDGTARPLLEKSAASAGLKNFQILPPQPEAKLAALLATADVGLVTARAGASRTSFPSRLYGLMAAGRPIVASLEGDSDAAQLVRTAGCGHVTPVGNVEAMARAVLLLRERMEERKALGKAARKYLENFHTKAAIIAKYDELLRQSRDRN